MFMATKPQSHTGVLALVLIWIGLILGISFYAAPIKFLAHSVPFHHLLAVGKVTFLGFQMMERGIAVIFLVLLYFRKKEESSIFFYFLIALLSVVVLLQQVWVFPVLDAQTSERLLNLNNGYRTTNFHHLFVALEFIKLALLISIAVSEMMNKSEVRESVK